MYFLNIKIPVVNFEKFVASSLRVFFRNKVEKKCIENGIYHQNYKLFDTIFFKNLLKVTKMKQNAQRLSTLIIKILILLFCKLCLSKNNFKLIFCVFYG